MAVELSTLAGCTVRSVTVESNAARVLEAEHAVKVDSGAVLAVGTAVQYTDPDLGLIFSGKIVERTKAYRGGEGVTYRAADAYRLLAKHPAVIVAGATRTGKIKIKEGTSITDALTTILTGASGFFPGGIAVDGVSGALPALDKGGQSMDTWLDDLLKYTEGGIALCEPNGGSPRLHITDYYSSPGVTLRVGSYNVINPVNGELLLVEGETGQSINNKYRKLTMEGAGRFHRYRGRYMDVTYPPLPGQPDDPDDPYDEFFRVYLPEGEAAILGRFINDGECLDAVVLIVRVGGILVYKFENPIVVYPDDGQPFFVIPLGGILVENHWPTVEVWAHYTAYLGPLNVSVEGTDPALDGELWEIHSERFAYTDDEPENNVDHTAELQSLATRRYKRQGWSSDKTGSLAVHVKGLNASLKVGSPVTNFDNMRVRRMRYDLVKRDIVLELSDVPLREALEAAKTKAKIRTQAGTRNWWQNKDSDDTENCFSGWDAYNGDGGTVTPPGGDPPGGAEKSFDCVDGKCVEREGPGGAFQTNDACTKRCGRSYDCYTNSLGHKRCQPRNDSFGTYPNLQDCLDDGCETGQLTSWSCPKEGPPCQAVFGDGGEFATKEDCEMGCEPHEEEPPPEEPPPEDDPPDLDLVEVLKDAVCDDTQPGKMKRTWVKVRRG